MTAPLDEQLTAALGAEADRGPDVASATASAAAWRQIERRITRTRTIRRTAVAATAAVACLAAGLFAVASPLDRDDDADLETRDELDLPRATTVPDAPPDSQPDGSPDGSPDPVGDQPGPAPRRDTPPETLVAITEDGRVVVVDTETGEEIRELSNVDAPHPEFPATGPDSIEHVEMSPDGATVWYDTCCSPNGMVYRAPIDGSGPAEPAASGYSPTFASDPGWVATVAQDLVSLNFPTGDWSRYWQGDAHHGIPQDVAWSYDGTRVVVRTATAESDLESGQLLVLDPTTMGDLEAADAVEFDHQDPETIGGPWKLPVFRRDNRLVVAQRAGDGQWTRVVLDLDFGPGPEVPLESTPVDGEPLDQDFDPSGEWLLTVVREPDSGGGGGGVLQWVGPDGQTGTVPGRYMSASW